MKWQVVFSKAVQKHTRKLAEVGLKPKAERLLATLADNPFQTPTPYEKLLGELSGSYSRRINI